MPVLSHNQKAMCPQCGLLLSKYSHYSLDLMIAAAIAGIIFLLFSLPFEFLSFSAQGRFQQMTLISSVELLFANGYIILAIIQTLAIFFIPLLILLLLLYLVVPIRLGKGAPWASEQCLTFMNRLIPWSMAEIFLVGTLVSLIKIASMADIGLGKSFIAYVGFTLCIVLAISCADNHQLMKMLAITPKHKPPHPKSVQHTWALILTACLCYLPASLLPIMTTRLLGQDDPATIMGGVVLLWHHGSYFIAGVIFVASVLIPILKIMALIALNLSVQQQKKLFKQQRTVLYRVTELIGRWSMIDVFVVAILVSLVQLGNTMTILPGPAAIAFSGVVVLTMLAANTFDSTRIWTNKE